VEGAGSEGLKDEVRGTRDRGPGPGPGTEGSWNGEGRPTSAQKMGRSWQDLPRNEETDKFFLEIDVKTRGGLMHFRPDRAHNKGCYIRRTENRFQISEAGGEGSEVKSPGTGGGRWCSDLRSLIQQYTLVWAIQRERWYLDIETLTALGLHLVSAAHHPGCRVERAAARIFEALAGLEDWLLANDTRPLDLCEFTTRICDHPVPAQKLYRFESLVLDDHAISPEILRVFRRRSRLEVSRHNAYRYSSCVCFIRCWICHRESLEQTPSLSNRGLGEAAAVRNE